MLDLRKYTQINIESSKVNRVSPYEYIKSIVKKTPLTEHQKKRFDTDYSMFVINRWLLPYCHDIIQLNMYNVPKMFHYKYLYKAVTIDFIPKMKLKNIKVSKNIKNIMKFHGVDYEEANLLNKFASKKELKEIDNFYKQNK